MNEATLAYVRQHADDDVRQLALRGSKDAAVNMTEALQQIAGRQTARKKLPAWATLDDILYPPHLNMEQCSSEQAARYKASVCHSAVTTANTLVDLTGGLGVDFSFMAPLFSQAVYVERQEELCRLARHNLAALGVQSTVVCDDAAHYLHHLDHVSLLFVDPARRDTHGARTYGIADCTPDVLTLRDELLQKAEYVMQKLSPMLDWRKTVSDLGPQYVREVHIVSVGGECKELLVLMAAPASNQQAADEHPLRIVCVNDEEVWEVPAQSGAEPTAERIVPQGIAAHVPVGTYLYEPNASVMKAGCFDALSACFGVSPLAQNSHLFTSADYKADFPGRKFHVHAVSSMNKRELKEKILPLKQANITIRNFPLSVADLRRRLKLSDGGHHYLFATTLHSGDHVLIVCQPALS